MAIDISVIIPVHNEQGNIEILFAELKDVLDKTGRGYEVIFVDDGSTDNSLAELKSIAGKNPQARVVSFMRNFGQTAALSCGFKIAQGEIVIPMDSDLQNDPADIPALLKEMADKNNDIISGWRKDRKDPFLSRKLPSHAANWLISLITGVHLHDYGCTLKAYRKDVIKHIALYGEMHRFLPAVANWRGAKISEVAVNHRPRKFGKSKYGIIRTFKVLLDLVTVKFLGSYFTKPIYFFGGIGIMSYFGGVFSCTYLIWDKLVHGKPMIQSPLLLLTAMLMILGTQFILMGLLAEISVRIYHESRSQEVYAIKETVNVNPTDGNQIS